jgi:peptidyl-prolyl cis-trans isomerase A (cyclophilin A)
MQRMTRCLALALALLLLAAAAPAQQTAAKPKSPAQPKKAAKASDQAPVVYQARFETSKGVFVIEVTRAWAPRGADRFYKLVKSGYYDGCRFFRVIAGFMVQFGINGDPAANATWNGATLTDDPVVKSNLRGFVSFAMRGPDTRTTQVFINFDDRNANLDGMGFAPFGRVVEGMEVVDSLYSGYGEGAPRGRGPDQGRIQEEGNKYLAARFPKLDYIVKAVIVPAVKGNSGQ